MVTSLPSGTTLFIVDTEQPASLFAENMCAFLTGRVGDTGIGEDYAVLYSEQTEREPLEDVRDIQTTRGFHTPCSPWETPGWFNNGMGGYYRENQGQERQAVAHFRDSVCRQHESLSLQKQSLLAELQRGKKIGDWTVSAAEREIKRHTQQIIEARETRRIRIFPAYLSVAIFLSSLRDSVADFMKLRALSFVELQQLIPDCGIIKVTGFRIIRVQASKVMPCIPSTKRTP